MKKLAFALGVLLALGACTTGQVTTAQSYQAKIAGVCNTAMTLVSFPLFAPFAAPVAPWVIGGCATEEAIAKLALDPSSLAWVNGLINKMKGVA